MLDLGTITTNLPDHMVIRGTGREVMRVDADGRLSMNVEDAPEAAAALMAEWDRCFAQTGAAIAVAEAERLRRALEAIDQAVIDGKVCDDVAWFSEIETLHDFIQSVLHPCEPAAVADLFEGQVR